MTYNIEDCWIYDSEGKRVIFCHRLPNLLIVHAVLTHKIKNADAAPYLPKILLSKLNKIVIKLTLGDL